MFVLLTIVKTHKILLKFGGCLLKWFEGRLNLQNEKKLLDISNGFRYYYI